MQAPKRHIPYVLVMLWLVTAPAWALDSDGDGVDDSLDQFPADPVAWEDTDTDGKPDNYVVSTAGDGFESGSFSTFGWVTSNPYPWSITTSYKSEGTRGAISTSTTTQTSYIAKTITATGGQLTYWVRAVPSGFFSCSSSGGGYGGSGGSGALAVGVDGVSIRFIPCSTVWQKLSIPLSAGTHTYRFEVATCGSFCSASARWVLDDVRVYDTALVEDLDDDNDLRLDTADLFPKDPAEWADNDIDGLGDNADTDDDDDSIPDVSDNCALYANISQSDLDGDGIGYPCDSDTDGDGTNNDGDSDDDNDGVGDTVDTFPLDPSRSVGHNGILYNFYGHNSGDGLGYSVSGAGDVNGDGYADVIAGAPWDDNTTTDAGSARVLSGATGEMLYQFNGQANNSQGLFGYSVSGAGDLDGDGRPDLLVGAINDSDGTNTLIGSVWRYSGATGTTLSFNYGSDASDQYGISVSGIGDINGDGRDDFVVGARQDELTTANVGCARVYSGINNAQLFAFCGQLNNDYFGESVSGAGDVNNDGYPDIIVGAPQDDTKASNAGKAVVLNGQNGAVLYTWLGKNASDQFGGAVSGAGDVNNDGYDDVIVGTQLENYYGSADVGSARVYSGQTGKVLYTWYGDHYDDRFGQSVSGVGDINGDGYDDVAVGAPYDDNGFGGSGSVTVYSGATGGVFYRMDGGQTNAYFGRSVSGAGDVNADGVPDLVAGANNGYVNGSNSGTVRVFSGKALLTDSDGDGQNDAVDTDDDNDGVLDVSDDYPQDATKTSDPDGDRIESSVDNCDNHFNLDQVDFDGDGQGDICDYDDDNDGEGDTTDKWPFNRAIALDTDKDGFADAWTSVCDLVCQTSSGLTIDNCLSYSNVDQLNTDGDAQGDHCDLDDDNDTVADTADTFPLDNTRSLGETGVLYTFYGKNAYDYFGLAVAGAGDVNNDGYDDIIIGAPWADPNGDGSGSAQVLSGFNGSLLYQFAGGGSGYVLGLSVAGGDVNGDGYADIVIGVPGDMTRGADTGQVRVISGINGATLLHSFVGDNSGDQLGASVAMAGDVNNDGYLDIIAGAPKDDDLGADSGSARVYNGLTGAFIHTFYGNSAGDNFGHVVSGAGDVNNDGYDDLVVGAPYDDPAGITDAGSVSVYSGANGALLYSYAGTSTNEYFGYSVSGAGDVNKDGYDDFVVGAHNRDKGDPNSMVLNAGAAVVYGGMDGSILHIFKGDLANDNLGMSVAGVGDVNGDGYDDVMAGIPADDNESRNNSGSARVYNGADGSIIYGFNGDITSDGFGGKLGSAGDINNDGYPDFVIAAADHDYNGTSAGLVRVFSGKSKWLDTDNDGINNAVDVDDDNDGVNDIYDAAPLDPMFADDFDKDGVDGLVDNCPSVVNVDQIDTDVDTLGNACDLDDDNDGALDGNDKFPLNLAASSDTDNDGHPGSWNAACDLTCQAVSGLVLDNCPTNTNPDQLDTDNDAAGNACDTDDDNDGVTDDGDNCPLSVGLSADQTDTDGDGQGNLCDAELNTPTTNVLSVNGGGRYTCVVTQGGAVQCWGLNSSGQLGDGTTINRSVPVVVSGMTSGMIAVSASWYDHTCALTSSGGVKCWGNNSTAQLGNGTLVSSTTPVDVSGLASGVSAIEAGSNHTCVITTASGMKCWGSNSSGQLGDGSTLNRSAPVDVSGLASGVSGMSAGLYFTCALTAAGGVKCWGYNFNGQLGDGTVNQRTTPVDVLNLGSGVSAIASGFDHTCALTTGGGVKCWGKNNLGQLGDGTLSDRYGPVNVSGLSSGVTAITAGYYHTCALMNDGAVKCWGENSYGQLGDDTAVQRKTPVDVLALAGTANALSAGGFHTCAQIGYGLQCWGENYYGQLGDNTTTNRDTPVYVAGLMGDDDQDGIITQYDNCPFVANEAQEDMDSDGIGSECDDDIDGDGYANINDELPLDPSEWLDTDGDFVGNNADTDDDDDGFLDGDDAFPLNADRWQHVRHNSDTDNDSDVLVRSASTGAWTRYSVQNNAIVGSGAINAYTSSSVQYVAQLDANGDGDADILTRNTATGAWYLHQIENGAATATTPIYLYASLDQQFIGTGDFNNDGTDDVMLRSASAGYYTVFLLSNHAVSSTVYYNAWVSASSVPQAIGDFDGDGTDDLLVRRSSDNLYFIFKTTNGGTTSNYCACNIWANTDWTFQFAGDTNDDGIDDVIVRGTGASADGKWWAFRMNNFKSVLTTNLNLFINKTAITVGAVGDYNGDGTVDVLTRVNNSTTYVSPIVNGAVTGNYWLYNFTADQVIGR